MRLLGRRQQRDLADFHSVHRHHMAAHEPVPSSIPIQPQVRTRQEYFYNIQPQVSTLEPEFQNITAFDSSGTC